MGIHVTDLGRYLVEDVTEVYGLASGNVRQIPGLDDNAPAFEFGRG